MSKKPKTSDSILMSMPDDIINRIIVQSSSISICNVGSLRIACKTFNKISHTNHFYKSIDLVFMKRPNGRNQQFALFMNLCFKQCNPTAVFLRGVSNYFHNNLPDYGLAQIKEAAKEGCESARYTYVMILRIIKSEDREEPILYDLSREFVLRTRQTIKEECQRVWGYQMPILFQDKVNHLDLSFLWVCNCASYNPFLRYWDDGVKENTMCDDCFWKLEEARFCKIVSQCFNKWPM